MLDLIVKSGTVVDGTGSPGFTGDVGISGGRIAAVGTVDRPAARIIDAAGMVVAPGFVDVHTHYDAQLFWDPAASPSNEHGVTTVLGGNCGFTLAPLRAEDSDYIRRMMAKVEGMPLPALEQGLPWSWSSFAEYLDALEGRIGVNAGFLVGHSAIRRYVMGPDATGNTASPEQVAEMVRVLHEALEAGGLGFSSSQSTTHSDGNNDPVPSYFADRAEMLALAGAVSDHPGTWLEFIITGCQGFFSDDEIDLMTQMSVRAQRSLNWNVLSHASTTMDRTQHQLGASDVAARAGGRIVALSMPSIGGLKMSFATYCALYLLPNWGDILYLDHDDKKAKLADPAVRRWLDEQARSSEGPFQFISEWANMEIGDTYAAENDGLTGRRVGDVAAERGKDPFDTLLDIVVADDLQTALWPQSSDDIDLAWQQRAELWRDQRVLVGGSDAGAHLDRMCGARYPTEMLATCVRDRGLLSLEECVRLMTDLPARLFGLRGRGRVAEGFHADLVVFDPGTVASGPIVGRTDLPAACERLYAGAIGVEHVMVNGTSIITAARPTGATPGTLLRSGRDTETVLP
ncbi:N-acyl-D-amino-acid deacylase family protein [Candidatus Poriferisocius sp.]|uniref:N-acyl-D-amino-acid deacylase family protein n=1 Tax=Candidatus Poriferisocius sp. TaxID=3101276 RepID=UPI003B01907F